MSVWNKNGKGRNYKGSYERDKKNERVFILTKLTKVKREMRRISFESFQAAKKLGWKKS